MLLVGFKAAVGILASSMAIVQDAVNNLSDGLRAALASPLFHKIRAALALGWEHTGGCTLYEHRDEVEALLQNK